MSEVWKPIKGYTGLYCVSSKGRVKSLDRLGTDGRRLKGRILSTKGTRHGGYPVVGLTSKSGLVSTLAVHILVAKAFIPNIDNKPQVNHIDGNTRNSFADNLEWVTNGENQKHACRIGLKRTGEEHHNAKLVSEEIDAIRLLYLSNKYTQYKLAKMFGVKQSYISRVINFKKRNYKKEGKK